MPNISSVNYFENLEETVRIAIAEDVGSGDITAQLVPEEQTASAVVITREEAIVCGRPWVDEVFRQIDPDIKLSWLVDEGGLVAPNDQLFNIEGKARSILTAERTALNFLQTLMATATTSKKYSELAGNSGTKILDTRKTIPGLRLAQKYAVKVGGNENHRIGLYDAFLIKENHIAACGGISNAIQSARKIAPSKPVEVEVESIEELDEAINAGADRIMLDNFSDKQLQEAIDKKTPCVAFEISGNITKDSLQSSNLSRIDYVSSGAVTKNIEAIDLSLRFF